MNNSVNNDIEININEFIEVNQGFIFKSVIYYAGKDDNCEDLFQEIIVRIIEKKELIAKALPSRLAYVRCMISNYVKNVHRKLANEAKMVNKVNISFVESLRDEGYELCSNKKHSVA